MDQPLPPDRLTPDELAIVPSEATKRHFAVFMHEYEAAMEAEDEGWISNVVSEFRKKFAVLNQAEHGGAQQQAGHRLRGLAGTGRCSRRR